MLYPCGYNHIDIMKQEQTERKTKTHQIDQNAALTPDQAHAYLGGNGVISRASFYSAIGRGEVPSLRLGRRILIPRAAFLDWLAGRGKVIA
jgi:excisionase family DNA binding protein